MSQNRIIGVLKTGIGPICRYEASWQVSGDDVLWKAVIHQLDGTLIGSPGGIVRNAPILDLPCTVRDIVEKTIRRWTGYPQGRAVRVPTWTHRRLGAD